MRPVKRGWTAALALVVSGSACAYSVGSSVFDPFGDAGIADSTSALTPLTTPTSTSQPVSSSSSGGGLGAYDAGRRDAEAGVVDSASVADVASDSGNPGNDGAAACNAQTCSTGCCDSSGRCAGTFDTACGKGGGACQDCTLTGSTCKAGSCTSSGSSSSSGGSGGRDGGFNLFCNPIVCWYGCCAADGTCTISSNTTCGTLGSACRNCTTTRQSCTLGRCF
jgi:hypothetical protein